jgi:hypothetical protein
MSAPAKSNEMDPLLHTAQVAKLLGVSTSWLAKSRLNGTGPRFIRRRPLMKRPGEYELVRQILGHRSVQTTINAYVGLENIRASEIFSKMVIEHMADGLEAAE